MKFERLADKLVLIRKINCDIMNRQLEPIQHNHLGNFFSLLEIATTSNFNLNVEFPIHREDLTRHIRYEGMLELHLYQSLLL